MGYAFNCGVTATNTVQCWGDGMYGQLGNGANLNSAVAVAVTGVTGAVQVVNGLTHACALLSGGTVKCWGANFFGKLGNGTSVNSSTAVDVAGLTGIKQIASGADHVCALTATNTVKCWGQSFNGRLGNNSTENSAVPVDVVGVSNVARISGGGFANICATLIDGTTKCWGDGASLFAKPGTTNPLIASETSVPPSVLNVLITRLGLYFVDKEGRGRKAGVLYFISVEPIPVLAP